MLLVSNLLLWENVASVPLSSDEIDNDQLYLKELFDHALILFQNISKLNTEMRRTYVSISLISGVFHKPASLSKTVLYPTFSYHEPKF